MKKREREVINPHDKIYIDCSDMQAAQLAILIIGEGAYGIEGDDGLPLFLFGGSDEWCSQKYNMPMEKWMRSVPKKSLKKALLSMRLDKGRSSVSDPVGMAHKIARRITE